ncbi:uncharacterized protein JN550_012678 [Neoarthrinium moseri]|uniref:uncharacterized protein n=1 Tax=Neoarthrinium moseri TaxID=1658444 RepID=UPI001FDC6CDF|nr:uncharacterized protein JN550_012678 [Neoarthrinium moseri]KAI1858394.1 hypothetical protein JN550_012678 [Neoarthrinium moseri]
MDREQSDNVRHEKTGDVIGNGAVDNADSKVTDRIDHGGFLPDAFQIPGTESLVVDERQAAQPAGDSLGAGVSRRSSGKSTTSGGGAYAASVNSTDRNNSASWRPQSISSIKGDIEFRGGLQATRSSIESSMQRGERAGSFIEQPVKQIPERQDSMPERKGTWNTRVVNTDLSRAANDPGAWVVSHHANGLIDSIKKNRGLSLGLLNWWKGRRRIRSPEEAQDKWKRPYEDKDFRINLAELQRMRLRKLQCKLVKHVAHMKKTGGEPKDWEEDLEAYIKAVQDYDYMINCSQLPRDPFLVSGERKIDSFVMHSLMGDVLSDFERGSFGNPISVAGPWEQGSQPIRGTRNDDVAKSWKNGFKERLVIAAVAGFFLIGPMWLMVLHNTQYTGLVSTTAFVVAFGIVMAWFLEKPKEVMSGTAAYAAVLVVFVGLGN